jgi:hypothetical protein
MDLEAGTNQYLIILGVVLAAIGLNTGKPVMLYIGIGLFLIAFLPMILNPIGGNIGRSLRAVRNPDGTFRNWIGGSDVSQSNRNSSAHGIKVHIGKEFSRQKGRTAKTGDIVRTKTQDGTYNKQASWYIRTKNGWRESPTKTSKPSEATIKRVNEKSRG